MLKQFIHYFSETVTELKYQNKYFTHHPRKRLFFAGGIVFIILWQWLFFIQPNTVSPDYGRKDASGFTHEYAQHFIYFYYYLNLFPVTTTYEPLEYSEQGAKRNLEEYGDSLLMEWKHWARLGDNARIFLYLPNAYIKGSPENPSIIPFNAIFFIISLLSVFVSFWYLGFPLLGFIIVLIFGSNPFLLYETYGNENIFGLMIATTLIIMSIHLHLFVRNSRLPITWLLPVISGVIIATMANVRSETSIIIASCLFVYLTIPQCNFLKKIALCLLLLLSFTTITKMWQSYFDRKFEEAYQVVESKGGNPYNGERIKTHTFWHPVYCGLGDFDTKYGYEWNDRKAYKYALPILKEKYNMDFAYADDLGLAEYYDTQKKYYKKIESYPEYETIIKEKVLSDIKKDPLWYAEILAKRIRYIFTKTSPVWLSFSKYHIHIPFSGLLIIPFVVFLFLKKKWFQLKLLLFPFPLAATSIIIFAKKNTTYNSCFHLLLIALLFAWIIEFILEKKKARAISSF